MASSSSACNGLTSRPFDLIYFVYFATLLPAMVLLDFQAFYPPSIVPQALKDLHKWYILTLKDPFVGNTDSLYWFQSFGYCELFIQFPFTLYACVALWKGSQNIRAMLLAYGAHVATTVWPIIYETAFNPTFPHSFSERVILELCYVTYFIIPIVMIIDSFKHVCRALKVASAVKQE